MNNTLCCTHSLCKKMLPCQVTGAENGIGGLSIEGGGSIEPPG